MPTYTHYLTNSELVHHEYEDEREPDYWYWIQYREEDSNTRTSQRFDSEEEALRGPIKWSKWS